MRNGTGAETKDELEKTNGIELHRNNLLAELEARGIRLTAQRRTLVEELQNAERHLDAIELLHRANKRDTRVNRATVYRTLDLLKKQGLVEELDLMHLHGERHYYEARSNRDRVHMACFECGKIEEFPSTVSEELKKEIREACAFTTEIVRLEVGGRCRDCIEKGRDAKTKKKE